MTYEIRIWDRHSNVAELIWLMGNQPSPLDNWIFNDNEYKQTMKSLRVFASNQKSTYYHKEEEQHKHGEYNSRVNECS